MDTDSDGSSDSNSMTSILGKYGKHCYYWLSYLKKKY